MKKSKTDEGEKVYKSTCRLIQRWTKDVTELRKKYRTHPNARKVKVDNKGNDSGNLGLLGLDAEKDIIDWYQGIRDLGGAVNGVYLRMHAIIEAMVELDVTEETIEEEEEEGNGIDLPQSSLRESITLDINPMSEFEMMLPVMGWNHITDEDMVEMAADTAEGNAIFLKLPIDESIDETD